MSKLGIMFDEERKAAPGREVASNVTDIFLNSFIFGSALRRDKGDSYPNPDEVLRIESKGLYYRLYHKMELTDPHYFAELEKRKKALLGKPWVIIPSEIDPRAEEHADFINRILDLLPRFGQGMYELLDAIGKGWKAVEIIWDTQDIVLKNGKRETHIIPVELKGRPQHRFVFNLMGELKLLKPEEQWSGGLTHSSAPMGTPVPQRKFIVAQFDKENDNPYGMGLAQKCYWYYWFKKSLIKYAMIFSDKYGMPNAIGEYPSGTSDAQREALLSTLRDLQQDSVAVHMVGTKISLLEAQRPSAASIYKEMLDFFDDSISKAILGQTLSASEGRRSGSLALGEVHADVRQDLLEDDAEWLAQIVNSTLIHWAIDFNFSDVLDRPKIKWQVEKGESLQAKATTYSTIKNLGMSLAKHQLLEEFKLEEPLDAEDTLPGGFGITGEQPFNVAEDQGGDGGGFGNKRLQDEKKKQKDKASGKKGSAENKPANPGEQDKQRFADDDEAITFAATTTANQSLDRILPAAIGAGINSFDPIRRGIERLAQKKSLDDIGTLIKETVSAENGELQRTLVQALFAAFQAGRFDIRRNARDTAKFVERISDDELVKLVTNAARSIANQQGNNVVRITKDILTDSLRAGDTPRQFINKLESAFTARGITIKNPHRIKTIFETSMATAYNSGRVTELRDMEDTFPWWIYLTRDDDRVRKNHARMHFFVARANARVWNRIHPPNGFNCRCIVDGLTSEEFGLLRGKRLVLPRGAGPDPGFKTDPVKFLKRL